MVENATAKALQLLLDEVDQRSGKLPIAGMKQLFRAHPNCKDIINAAGGIHAYCSQHATSLQLHGSHICRAVDKELGQAGSSSNGKSNISIWELRRRTSLLTLRLFALRGKKLHLHVDEFDALALMAMQLCNKSSLKSSMMDGSSGMEVQGAPAFAIVALAERYQTALRVVSELAEILGLSKEGARLLSPRHAFDGRLLRCFLECFAAADLPMSSQVRSLRTSEAFLKWRTEALKDVPEESLLRSVPAADEEHDLSQGTTISTTISSDKLPIMHKKAAVLKLLRNSRVVCLRGATGSGKSTQVPQFLLELLGRDARVVVTQPRRIAAIQLAKRVANEIGEPVGESVGYGIGGESGMTGSRINFMTTGFLLQLLVHNPDELQKISHVVLDEIHERSADADMLSLVLKLLMASSTETRLVIMSATLEASLVAIFASFLHNNSTIQNNVFQRQLGERDTSHCVGEGRYVVLFLGLV